MNQFVIATHSELAEGYVKAINFFRSDLNNIHFINAYTVCQEFEKDFLNLIDSLDGNRIVLTDIANGSVNQVCTKHMQDRNYQLITGVNFPLVLELVFHDADLTTEDLQNAVSEAKEQMIYMNSFFTHQTAEDNGDDEDL